MMQKKDYDYAFKYYQDPGHGWIACEISLLIQLGLFNKISKYSYQKGRTVYLEEDCDGPLLYHTLRNQGKTVYLENKFTNKRSPIRSYESFSLTD